MIKYFQVKSQKGTKRKSLIFRERSKKYSKKIRETYIKKTESLLILGSHASGKSRELNKILVEAPNIYKHKDIILINATDSFSEWFSMNTKKRDEADFIEGLEEDLKDEIVGNIRKQHIRIQILLNKCERSLIFIDDLDLMNGKKKEIVKDIMRVSSVVIATAKSEHAIDKTLMTILYKKKYNEIILMTDVSYDATNIIFVAMMLGMLASGMHEVAILIMAGRYMMKGKDKK